MLLLRRQRFAVKSTAKSTEVALNSNSDFVLLLLKTHHSLFLTGKPDLILKVLTLYIVETQ